jgi:hypothetical protein
MHWSAMILQHFIQIINFKQGTTPSFFSLMKKRKYDERKTVGSPTFHTDNKLQTRHNTLFFFFDEKAEV